MAQAGAGSLRRTGQTHGTALLLRATLLALLEVLQALKAAEVDDRIRTATEALYQALIEAELTAVIGAAPHERTDARTAQRNGSRPRVLTTTAGDLELRIPELRAGSFFPSLLERRRRIDQALFAVVIEAYPPG
jgi:transposase-like protein